MGIHPATGNFFYLNGLKKETVPIRGKVGVMGGIMDLEVGASPYRVSLIWIRGLTIFSLNNKR